MSISLAETHVRLEGWIKFSLLPGVNFGEIGTVALHGRIPMKRLIGQVERLAQVMAESG